mmetsp:Transcript_90892/g.216913  ORF Transcript_90892/g.216913 Transcript_90892/m.216913 type:complete len:220 (-) Transcript_90892:444-1103(-)
MFVLSAEALHRPDHLDRLVHHAHRDIVQPLLPAHLRAQARVEVPPNYLLHQRQQHGIRKRHQGGDREKKDQLCCQLHNIAGNAPDPFRYLVHGTELHLLHQVSLPDRVVNSLILGQQVLKHGDPHLLVLLVTHLLLDAVPQHACQALKHRRQHQAQDHGARQREAATTAKGPGAQEVQEVRLSLHLVLIAVDKVEDRAGQDRLPGVTGRPDADAQRYSR